MAVQEKGSLSVGTCITTEKGKQAKVVKYLGAGGQGEVYIVDYSGEKKALKWYINLGKNPEAFRDNLMENVQKGSPDEAFLWPLDVTEWKDETFGYIMDLKGDSYHELTKFLIGKVEFKSWKQRIDACLKIITGFRILHNRGYSYQDLNDGNFFIDPNTGRVQIADNDNVAPSGENLGILGKPRYMAPEIVRNENLPDTQSDRYSLAMILFMVICCGHPLEGREGTPPILTDAISTVIYGTNPVFIFDPDNDRNRPIPNIHKGVINIWNCLPDYMQDIFVRAFSHDSLYQKRRVIEVDWIKALVRFRSDILQCSCGSGYFVKENEPIKCDVCGKTGNVRNTIQLSEYSIPAVEDTRIYRIQLGTADAEDALNPIAAIVEKNGNPNVLGLMNASGLTWSCTTSKGQDATLADGQVLPVKSGIKIRVYDSEFVIK